MESLINAEENAPYLKKIIKQLNYVNHVRQEVIYE